MTLTNNEINELYIICTYLTSDNSEIVDLGLSLYKIKYEDKLKNYITNIVKRELPTLNCILVRCDYTDEYGTCWDSLPYVIRKLLNDLKWN